MTKTTIFTILFALIVTLVVAELARNDFFISDEGQASIVTLPSAEIVVPEPKPEPEPEVIIEDTLVLGEEVLDITEEPANEEIPDASLISSTLIQMGGFTGQLRRVPFSGKIFQLLDVRNLQKEAVFQYLLFLESIPVISISETLLADELKASTFYDFIKNKSQPYIDVTVNETNSYGDNAFYVNHRQKPGEAFLVVKLKNRVYSFAYLKVYHPYIENIVTLLQRKAYGS